MESAPDALREMLTQMVNLLMGAELDELAASLRSAPGLACPPVLFVTRSPMEAVARALDPEIRAGFLAKQFELEELRRAIRDLLDPTASNRPTSPRE